MANPFINANELIVNFERCLKNTSDPSSLHVVRNTFLNQNIKPLLNEIKKQKTSEEKKLIGLEYNAINKKLTEIFNERLRKINEERIKKDNTARVDAELPCVDLSAGIIHPLNSVVNDVINFFRRLNFDIYIGDELTTTEFCFDVLNIPLNHVTRSFRTSLYLSGSQEKLLRTHCTASTAKFIYTNPADEIKVITFGNVYRNDTEDATHSIQFKQIDFMWLRNDLTVANLKWLISELIRYLFGDTQSIRFRVSQFYFTEPSLEIDIGCWNCQNGCPLCKYSKWIEILGCGMLHENVIKASKLKQYKLNGIAGGIGIERITMLKYGLVNIHDFYKNDFRFLKIFKK